MAEIPAGLIWLASYPKSGNTWMRILLANLLAGKDSPADINRLAEPDTLVARRRFADDMLVDPDELHKSELETMRPLHGDFAAVNEARAFFCKTHDRFWTASGKPTLGAAARCALYLVRDPRDVAISLSHHAGISTDSAIEGMGDASFVPGSRVQLPYLLGEWSGHVLGWSQQSLVRTKLIRYEDLRGDTAGVLASVVRFLDGQAASVEIQRAVDNSRLEQLQVQEASRGFRESRPGQKQFFRSGRVGEWRSTLTAAQVRRIEDRFGDAMTMLGYVLEA